MAEIDDGLPESQVGRAQWLADELALCGYEEITAIDILDLRAAGLRRGAPEKQAYGKFTADRPNQLWQGDILHGPRVFQDGKEVTAKVVCWLDA